MTEEKSRKINPRNAEIAINLGQSFDSIDDEDDQYMALIMLMTGYMIENIKETSYEAFLDDFAEDAVSNIEAFKEFMSNSLANTETKGNA